VTNVHQVTTVERALLAVVERDGHAQTAAKDLVIAVNALTSATRATIAISAQ
jgi:hypothetical protein